ncbi:MAG: cupin domain-containing protein [Burkholderiales bacterium]
MSAITPNAKDHAALSPLASRFVQVERLPWEKTRFPGVEAKTLLVDRDSGLVTALMKFAPGARLPDHEHVRIEQTYVLEGSLVCGEGECKAGEYVWRPAGSRHEAWAGPQGGLMLAMFQVPNRFFEADGREVDAASEDWNAAWGKALFR